MDGTVSFCNHGAWVIGNATEEPLHSIWRGERAETLRRMFSDFKLPDAECSHCAHQFRIGQPWGSFANTHFDRRPMPPEGAETFYPQVLIFRMSNVCNLRCIMCNGETSSRIRKQVDKLPPIKPRYPDSFFAELTTFLDHAHYVEFYGGEPFLVREHLRIFDLLLAMPARRRPSLYVNTNGTVLTQRVERYLEELPFERIGVSLDGVSAAVNELVREGVDHRQQMENLERFHALCERRGIQLMLNVTETRQNWFELPDLFRLAARMGIGVHVNHCIFPDHCTLYTLPLPELKFVLDRLTAERDSIEQPRTVRKNNRQQYDFLLATIRQNYERRAASPSPETEPHAARFEYVKVALDGRLMMPSPESVRRRGPDCESEFRRALPADAAFAREWLARADGAASVTDAQAVGDG
jgi:MoaA/NifB/PqqE/SkfB family radical SAM enzyme